MNAKRGKGAGTGHVREPSAGRSPAGRQGSLLPGALVAFALLSTLVAFSAGTHARAVDVTAGFVALSATVAAVLVLARGGSLWPSSRLGLAWSAFLAWTLVGAALSGRFWSAFVGQPGGQMGWAMLIAITVLVVATRTAPAGVRAFLGTWAPLFLLAQALAVLVQLALGHSPAGTLPNSTYFGEMVLLMLPLAAGSELLDRSRWYPVALAVVMISTLAASASRVATVFALVWAVWALARSRDTSRRSRSLAIVVLLVAVVSAGMLFARAEIMGSAASTTLGDRPAMLHLASAAVAKRPVLGWGLEGFSAGGSAASTPELAARGPVVALQQGYAGDPHNIVANMLVSSGIVGLALMVWLVVEVVLRWSSLRRTGRQDSASAWGVAGFLVILMTAPATAHVLPLFALVLGLSLTSKARTGSVDMPDLDSRLGGRIALGLAAIVTLVFAADMSTRLPFEHYDAQVALRTAPLAQRAAATWRVDPQLYYLASLHWGYVAQVDPVVASAKPDVKALEKAAGLDRTEPFYQFELARTLRFYREPPKRVEAAFAETFQRYPIFPLARAEYAVFLAEQGRADDARRQIEIARLTPDVAGATEKAIAEAEERLLAR